MGQVVSPAVSSGLNRRDIICTLVVNEQSRAMLSKSVGMLNSEWVGKMESVELFIGLLGEVILLLGDQGNTGIKMEACKAVLVKLDSEWVRGEAQSKERAAIKLIRQRAGAEKWLQRRYVPKNCKLSMGVRVKMYCDALETASADLRAILVAEEVTAVRLRDVPIYMRDERTEDLLR